MRRQLLTICTLLTLTTGLAACGHSMGERALTGGAIGAGAGALFGAAAGGDPGTGALIGGLGGAAIGAATTDQGRGYDDDRRHHRHRHHHRDYDDRY